ncbi:TFIIB-type zinc ribbon-containing protein [Candidatus Micrarchaeota archaeon]|nr:TFIIB-type zinc ribbon-containing protein [Candidatus Micrarchaeota archaeon]
MDVACPQCGNPNLDVDPQNSVVYCKNCGFAVQVDPQTGNVQPLSQGSVPATGEAQAPAAYQETGTVFGMDKLTFFMVGLAAILLAVFALNLDITLAGAASLILLFFYFKR